MTLLEFIGIVVACTGVFTSVTVRKIEVIANRVSSDYYPGYSYEEEIADEMPDEREVRINSTTVAEELHPNVKNIPHDEVKTKTPVEEEYSV